MRVAEDVDPYGFIINHSFILLRYLPNKSQFTDALFFLIHLLKEFFIGGDHALVHSVAHFCEHLFV